MNPSPFKRGEGLSSRILTFMKWPWSRSERTLSPVEQLHQWDGAYRWGELSDRHLRFGSAGSLQAPDTLLEDLANVSGARINRRDALKAMAVLRARNLIAGVPATLPIELRDAQRNFDDRNWLGVQPNPRLETTVVYAFTFEDLLFESTSYWRIRRRASDGFPVEAEHLDHRAVSQHQILGMPSQVISEDHQFAPGDPIYVDGIPMGDEEVIRFTSPNPPLLVHAAKAIRQVLLLDKIAADYALDPLPYGYFKDATDEEPMEDEEINEVIGKWEHARRQHRWGYIESGLELNSLEWPNPQQLQLVQARNHAVLEIARGAGLDPEDVGVNIEGTSRTYQNAEQRRLDLIDFVLMPYISSVQDRLSMNDITPRGLFAQFQIAAFTRADFKARMEGYKLAIEAGVMMRNEVRRLEGWPDLTDAEIDKTLKSGQPPPMAQPGNVSRNGNGRESVGANDR